MTGVLEVAGRRSSSTASRTATTRGARATGARPQHWKWILAHTPSGRALNAFVWIARGEWGFNGYVLRDGAPVAIAHIDQRAAYDDGMDQTRLEATITDVDGETTALTLDSFGAVRMPHDDPFGTVIIEAACRATIDGEAGGGQFETHWPLQLHRPPGGGMSGPAGTGRRRRSARCSAFLGCERRGPLTTQAIGDGHSNLTYLVTRRRAAGRRAPSAAAAGSARRARRAARGAADRRAAGHRRARARGARGRARPARCSTCRSTS